MNKQARLAKIDAIIDQLKKEGDAELLKCWEHHRAEVVAQKEDKATARMAKIAARFNAFRLGQMVTLSGKCAARVVDIARNGVWILRNATDGEFVRIGKEQVRERVSINAIA